MKLTAFPRIVAFLALLLCWGSLASPAAAQEERRGEWEVVAIIAPRQTVLVEMPRGSYTARFENEALVFGNGNARGMLALSNPGGAPRRFRVFAGRARFDDNGTVTEILLRLREVDPNGDPDDELTITLSPSPNLPEDCLIYTTLGTKVNWVARGRIVVFRN